MSSTLLLRLAAPLQSWGDESKFNKRRTWKEPSKSGVIGMVAAALGVCRTDEQTLQQLNSLRFGVRVDQPGKYLCDYHMVIPYELNPKTGFAKTDADGLPLAVLNTNSTYVTKRYYLSDAVFVVGLEGEEDELKRLLYALRHPVYPLFLGRRSCPPSLPMVAEKLGLGIVSKPLVQALRETPWQAAEWWRKVMSKQDVVSLRIVVDAPAGEVDTVLVRDQALSFSPLRRRYGKRRTVAEEYQLHLTESGWSQTGHDVCAELEEE